MTTIADNPSLLTTGLLVGGEERPASAQRQFEVRNPATGTLIGYAAEADEQDAASVVEVAARAFQSSGWRKLAPTQRAPIMRRIAALIRRQADQLAQLETQNNGMLLSVARAHTESAASMFDFYADLTPMVMGAQIPVPGTLLDYTVREPVGVVAAIIPWNAPLATTASKLAPALAAGNAVIVKPASLTPFTAILMGRLCQEAGVPAGVVSVLTGPGATAGTALVAHPRVDKVSLTGDTATGRQVMRVAADRLKRVTLECGGKSPTLVFADADIDQAIGDALSAFRLAGQVCFAGTRLLVQRPVYDTFVERYAQRTRALKVGDPMAPETNIGPLISRGQLNRVSEYVEIGRQERGRLLAGGEVAADGSLANGHFYQPTVFADVDNGMRVAQEEIFGPVVVIIPFESIEDGVQMANDSIYGLAARVYTRDLKTAILASSELRAGTVSVNQYMLNFMQTPYGGFKQSGFGREYGVDAVHAYTEVKNVVIGLN
jgi:betaine-aldehyde dehydrogenase